MSEIIDTPYISQIRFKCHLNSQKKHINKKKR